MKDFLSQAGKLLKEHKQYKRQLTVFLCLAVIVAFGTVTALKLYGQAMTHKTEVLECGYEVHEHTEECYERDEDGNLGTEPVCGLADYVIHVHNDLCYDAKGNLVCTMEEHESHEHEEECYTTEKVLICGMEAVENTEESGSSTAEPENTTEPAAATEPTAEAPAKQEGPVCGKEVHEHVETCYENAVSCGYEEHVHNDGCISHDLNCEVAEHAHGDGCYDEEGNLVCEMEEHAHVIGCYDTEGNIICGQEHEHIAGCYINAYTCGQEAHTHEEGCYTSTLTCTLEEHEHTENCYQKPAAAPETSAAPAEPEKTEPGEPTESGTPKGHVHTDACYEEVTTLTCGELELHTHDDSCYDEECFDEDGNLIEGSRVSCGLLQLEEHVHTHTDGEDSCIRTVELTPEEVAALENGAKLHIHEESCYDEEGNLICGHDATHIHVPECYDDAGELICGYGTAIHVHENSCYDEEGNLICGYETATHVHGDSCYDADGNLQCGYEAASHVHEDSCYDADGNLVCGYLTASHVHEDSCYDADGNLQCGYETAKHEHEDSCYDEEGNLICGYDQDGVALSALYCKERIHAHDDSCYDEEQNLVCGKADFAVHTHADDCYNVEGQLICPLPEIEAHVHGTECYPEGDTEGEAEPACGKEEIQLHTHTEECYDENGALICGQLEILEHVHSEACRVSNQLITKTFESENFIVTAAYKSDADIPDEAELIAEQITEESDSEHYAKRQAEYQEALGDDMATMRALLKIGFYVNGQEVEPESPVTITIQFLNEDGLAEGKPITVIHFVEDGTELLEGSKVEDGSTTFEMESFSEIAVGYGVENVRVPVDTELKYETDEFEVTFRIEGEVNVPVGDMGSEEEPGAEGETAAPDSSAESEAEESGTGDDAADEEAEAGTDDAESAELPEGSESGEAEDSGDVEADVMISENGVSVIIENSDLEKELEFRVDPLDENAEEYAKAAAAVYTDGTEGADELDDQLFLQVLSYKMLYDGKKLDLSDCTVTAEVKPSEALVEYAETAVDPMTLDLDGEEQIADGVEVKPEVVITAVELGENAAEGEIADAMVVGYEAMAAPMLLTLRNEDGTVAIVGTSQANPEFTVEFYAEIDVLADAKENNTITVIDTAKRDADGNLTSAGEGGNLPINGTEQNKTPNKKLNIKVASDGTVEMEKKLTEVYSSGSYDYISAPGLVYFNKIAKNDNYVLKEITVQRKGSGVWETYSCENGKEWHFTNKQQTRDEYPDEFILITSDATIRLVHTVKTDTVKNGANFYDYDVSNGNLYKAANAIEANLVNRGDAKTHDSGALWYMYTNRQGINSNSPDQTFGFGNSEGLMKTTMGDIVGNKANGLNAAYGSPTFGLVTGLKDGKIQYAGNVKAPNLFNDGSAKGKSEYVGDLIFSQSGDTYTLTGVEVKEKGNIVSSQYGVDKFKRQRPNWNNTYYFAGNDFYPLDGVSSAGTAGHDLMFGKPNGKNASGGDIITTLSSFSSASNTLGAPVSDDGENHNHYFGMHYTVDFDLVEDYVGPLEYLFYGDDDMWVFLDGPGYTGKLICDIGGVHSSVGEYVNLWDYIEKGTEGHYKLTFFYTERGASGSTCWMQFTLPSVSFATTEQDTGELRIQKKVNGSTGAGTGEETNEVFGFEIQFSDASGNSLKDDYSYTKFDADNNVVGNDILIWNNAKFTLKKGEYIVIKYLPHGSHYTIKEVGPVTNISGEQGEGLQWEESSSNPYLPETSGGNGNGSGVVTGTISKNSQVEIEYNNVLKFALPETGGSGTILYTMAGGIALLFGAGFLYKKKFRERRG